ncbi:DUF602-domain-containing protein [Artomyces pyxidatus]|uniref:DUF602-domain-containing protein n=1 Tax=Artomyces pyxidatus TaxID=48021 RepID=A0ACB8SLV8_9AGAM|nr:DUF602-domain-containing protein [Artomyces pyxidatus]
MGNDGGSIPDRRDLVRSKPKAEQADKANQTRARWFFCALSKRPLQEPIVACELGKLYNKEAILEFLLNRLAFGDGEEICGHIRSLRDVKTLTLAPNTAPKAGVSDVNVDRAQYVCPLTFKEMSGGVPFVYLATCGCVFSQAGLKAVASSSSGSPKEEGSKGKEKEGDGVPAKDLEVCPQCAKKFDRTGDVRLLNPPAEEEEQMRSAMERRRAAEALKPKGKKRKAAMSADDGDPPTKKKAAAPAPSMNPNIAAASRAVASSLAMEEAKRKAQMSDAVKSLYSSKDAPKRKETFMTMGTFTRVSTLLYIVSLVAQLSLLAVCLILDGSTGHIFGCCVVLQYIFLCNFRYPVNLENESAILRSDRPG